LRKVIDSNSLQSPELRRYLSTSPSHYAVLTDYAAMEAYKGNTLTSIFSSMEILAEYPAQVIVLKGTQRLCALKGRASGLQRRMIDQEQTRGFSDWCRHLHSARNGDSYIRAQLLKLGREATVQMDRVLADARNFATHLEGVSKTFTPAELTLLRSKGAYTEALFDKFVENTLWVAAFMFRDHPRITKPPSANQLRNTFIFRVALCYLLLALNWISVGGAKKVKPENIRNDMIDVNFAACATFFDGLMTADRKARKLYCDADFLIRTFFLEKND
jgi:hypothetical protein